MCKVKLNLNNYVCEYVNNMTATGLMFQKIVKSITTLLHFEFFVDSPNVLVYNHIKLIRGCMSLHIFGI